MIYRGADRASLVAQMVKNLPAIQDTWVQSLVWGDPLKKGMATHSIILAEELQGLYGHGSQSWIRLSDFHLMIHVKL